MCRSAISRPIEDL